MRVSHGATSRMLLSAMLTGLLCTGCPPSTPSETETLEFGVERNGTLRGGDNRTFLLPVEAHARYAISLVGTAGSLGVPDLRAEVRGQTSPENVVLDVRGLSLFRPEVVKGFLALEDGVLEFYLENRTEGLTLEQGFLRFLLGDASLAQYRVRAYELGPDDHGRTPANATRLTDEGESVLGTLVFGNDFDYFVLAVQDGRQYEVVFETSGQAKLATSFIDRFDEFNFEAATPGGAQFQLDAVSGTAAVKRFTANRSEDMLLGVAPGVENLLAGIFGVPAGFSSFPVRYAITVTSSTGGELVAGQPVEDVVPEGDAVEYFIALPPGTEQFVTELTGPTSLIAYINPGEPGSALDFQDFVSPFVEGEATTIATDAAPGVERYYFNVTTLSGRPADFSLRVTPE